MEDTRRINKLNGILLEDVRVQGLVEQASKGGFEVVDELPTENIKERTIYSVRKIDYYTSIYGTKIPTITSENQGTYEPIIEGALNSKGLTEEQVTNCVLVLSMGAFMVLNLNSDGDIAKNIFENNMFSYELTIMTDGEKKSIIYTATSITELYEYLFSDEWAEKAAELHGIELEGIQTMRDTLKSLNFKYQTTPLTTDEIGVVFETTYDYYIYNGKEWVNLNVGDKPVITKDVDWNNGNPIPQLEALTFTEAEFDSLKNNADLEIICNMSNKPFFTMYANKTLLTDSDIANGIEYEITVFGAFSTKRCRMMLTNNNGKIEADIVEPTNVTSSYITIPVSAWTEGGSGIYKCSAFTNVDNVETQSRVLVMFGKNDAESGNFSPYVDTVDGGLTIYAKEKPTTDVSIHVEVFN